MAAKKARGPKVSNTRWGPKLVMGQKRVFARVGPLEEKEVSGRAAGEEEQSSTILEKQKKTK